jgi:hypothetical protein
MGEVAVSASERLTAKTKTMTDAVYAALDAIDAYAATAAEIAAEQEASGTPNMALVKRMGQFVLRAESMTAAIEDDVLDHLNFCNDRLFSIALTERGEFI